MVLELTLDEIGGDQPQGTGVEVAAISVVNYTPLMLGGWDTATWQKLANGGYVGARLLAKPIVGRARWILRNYIIALGLASNQRRAETAIPIKMESGRKSFELGLVQLMWGSTNPPWKALYQVHVLQPSIPKQNAMDPDIHPGVKTLTVTRYKLLTMGKEDDRERSIRLQPVKPWGLNAFLKILRRPLPRSTIETRVLEEIDRLAILTTILSLRVYGVGKGATRGFGRFRTEITRTGRGVDERFIRDLRDLLRGLDQGRGDRLESLVSITLESISRLADKKGVGDALGKINVRTYKIGRANKDRLEGTYGNMFRRKERSKRLQYLRKKRGVYLALESIALATLKNAWKTVLARNTIRGGGDLHTWILGLPRQQKLIKNCWPTRDGDKLPTGYAVVEYKNGREVPGRFVLVSSLRNVRCSDPSEDPSDRIINIYEVRVDPKRAQSPIILFPLNADDRQVVIAAVVHKHFTRDYLEVYGQLYHLGGLASAPGPTQACAVRGVKVRDIVEGAYRKGFSICVPQRGGVRVYRNNPRSGIARPRNCTLAGESDVEKVLEAALCFIDEILGRPGV
ncbi:hypothetical protein apy_08780 [Aeropyrum pernix]|uniref:Uncharacterized protein n=1 Tax=Aeropyrum pernix TaxID=56636 RepID=A0A401H9T2_AERPX|nr:hypothetical protein [Aeropyrum pernix]GBF09153.1 hypothetical protein apy_08780 [Aeropyrum pernix]